MALSWVMAVLTLEVADLIGKELVGKLGEGYSDTLRTIIMNWLSEKGYFTKGEKNVKE
jgi:hypothetical protein